MDYGRTFNGMLVYGCIKNRQQTIDISHTSIVFSYSNNSYSWTLFSALIKGSWLTTFTSFLIAWQKIYAAFLTINTLMLYYSYIKVSCRRNRRHSCLFMSVLPKVKYFLLCCISETGTTRLTNEIELYSIFNHVNHGKVKSLRGFFFLNWCADTPGSPYAINASDAGRCEPRLQWNNKYKPVAVSDISRDTLKGFIRR